MNRIVRLKEIAQELLDHKQTTEEFGEMMKALKEIAADVISNNQSGREPGSPPVSHSTVRGASSNID